MRARLLPQGSLTPWGSLVPPKHASVEDQNGDFANGELDAYVNAILPDERKEVVSLRKEYHRKLHLCMKKRHWQRYDLLVDSLRNSNISLDEVSFTLLFNGCLLSPQGGLQHAASLLEQMRSNELMHPSLVRLHEAFLASLKDLEQFDAYPNELNLRKSLKPLWEISAEFKRNRMRAFRAFVISERPALPTEAPALPRIREPSGEAFWDRRDEARGKRKTQETVLDRLRAIENRGGLGWMSKKRKS
jgi:hypothetical protein